VTVSNADPDPVNPDDPGHGGEPGGMSMAGIIVLVIILLILICCLIFLCLWYIRKKNREEADDELDTTREHLQQKYGSLLQSQADTESEQQEEEKVEGNDNMLGALKNEGEKTPGVSVHNSLNFESGKMGRPI